MKIALIKASLPLLCFTCCFINPVHSQNLDPRTRHDIQSMFPKEGGGKIQKRNFDKLTISQQQTLMKDTEINPDGYLVVGVSEAYVNQIRSLKIDDLEIKPLGRDHSEMIMGMPLIGVKTESENRKAYFFGRNNTAEIMITSWNYSADGGEIALTDKFINQKFDNFEGTLSLTYNDAIHKGLWRLTVLDEEKFYEVVLPVDVINKKPNIPVAKALVEMRKLIDFTRSVE